MKPQTIHQLERFIASCGRTVEVYATPLNEFGEPSDPNKANWPKVDSFKAVYHQRSLPFIIVNTDDSGAIRSGVKTGLFTNYGNLKEIDTANRKVFVRYAKRDYNVNGADDYLEENLFVDISVEAIL